MSEVCFQNISKAGAAKRFKVAAVLLVVFIITAALALREPSYLWRTISITPLLAACMYFFQARAQVCVFLAASGELEIGGRNAAQEDAAAELGAIKSAQQVWRKTFLSTALIGGALLGLPLP